MSTEGTKPFTDVIRMLEGGELSEDLASALRDLNATLSEHAASNGKAKGKLTLTLEIVHEKGLIAITGDVIVKQPKAKRATTALWLTAGNNLSKSDPRQLEMGSPRVVRDDPAALKEAK